MTSKTKDTAPSTPSRMDQLLAGGYEIRRFADMTRPYQLAVAHYMAVDGEAWENLLKLPNRRNQPVAIVEALKKALPQYVERHADCKFGVARIPTQVMTRSIYEDPEISGDWPSWEAYRDWYCSPAHGISENHSTRNRWPVVLSCTPDETLQDGWHRVHCYATQGARFIPAIFFPQSHHLTAPGGRRSGLSLIKV